GIAEEKRARGPAAHPKVCLPLLPSGPDGVHKSGLRWAWPYGTRIDGGDDRDRTDDLLVANEALSQLSYIPTQDGLPGTHARNRRVGPWLESGADTSRPPRSVKPGCATALRRRGPSRIPPPPPPPSHLT